MASYHTAGRELLIATLSPFFPLLWTKLGQTKSTDKLEKISSKCL